MPPPPLPTTSYLDAQERKLVPLTAAETRKTRRQDGLDPQDSGRDPQDKTHVFVNERIGWPGKMPTSLKTSPLFDIKTQD
jgi:hypothetical protein